MHVFTNVSALYADSKDAIVPKALSLARGFTMETPLRFNYALQDWHDFYQWAKPTALLRTMPGFFFSSYPITLQLLMMLLPIDQVKEAYDHKMTRKMGYPVTVTIFLRKGRHLFLRTLRFQSKDC